MMSRVITAVAIVAGITSVAAAQDVKLPEIEFGRYHALVIGNNDYEHLRNLTTAVGDADAVAKLLEDEVLLPGHQAHKCHPPGHHERI